jgi:exopolysaccharide biosynthesis polyprenyl glycosylphosphotransferase
MRFETISAVTAASPPSARLPGWLSPTGAGSAARSPKSAASHPSSFLLAGGVGLLAVVLVAIPAGIWQSLLTEGLAARDLLTLGASGMFASLGIYFAPRVVTQVLPAPSRRRVVIVGSGPRALRVARQLDHTQELLGFVDSNTTPADPAVERLKLGGLDDLERVLMTHALDEVVIALPVKSHYEEIQRVIDLCEHTGTESKYLADVFACAAARMHADLVATLPLVSTRVAVDPRTAALKRAIDVVGALLALALALPLMLLIALAVKLSSEGPVFFVQERFGRNKRRFPMIKFRTMVAGAEEMQDALEPRNESRGPVFKIRDDPRITPVGRFLRRTSLDELPQLLNVLRDEMSLVGPRPLPIRDVLRFREAWLMRRFSVRPGITGLWQVSGRSEVAFDDWTAMDLHYIEHWTLGLDLRILARTIPAVLTGRGAQ